MSQTFATALALTCVSVTAQAADQQAWPRFLGPDGRGVQELAKPPAELSLETGVRWKIELPSGHSSPCIWDDAIFLTGYTRNSKLLETFRINRDTGEIVWRRQCPQVEQIEKVHRVGSPAAPTPVTDGKRVVVYFGSFGLLAYDFDGNELWRTPLPPAKAPMNYGSGSSPILVEERVILWHPQGNQSSLSAFQLADGKRIWETKRLQFNRTWATPVQWQHEGRTRLGMLASRRFSAFDAENGRELWWVDGVAVNSGSSPIVLGDQLLLTSAGIQGDSENIAIPDDFDTFVSKHDKNQDGKISIQEIPESVLLTVRNTSDGAGDLSLKAVFVGFMRLKPDHVFDREDWENRRKGFIQFRDGPSQRTSAALIKVGGTGDVTQSHRVWEQPRGVGEVPSPLVYRGLVYLVKNGGLLTVRSRETGARVSAQRIRGAGGGYYASPVAADGRIYLATDAGVVTVIEAGPELRLLSQCELKAPVYATPAIVGDTLYVRTTKHLYAFMPPAAP